MVKQFPLLKMLLCFQVERAECKNCLVWAKSDSVARDIIRLSSDFKVGYIVMVDPNTGLRTNLFEDEGSCEGGIKSYMLGLLMMWILWENVDDVDSMGGMLFKQVDVIVTSNPSLHQQLMQDIRRMLFKRVDCQSNPISISTAYARYQKDVVRTSRCHYEQPQSTSKAYAKYQKDVIRATHYEQL